MDWKEWQPFYQKIVKRLDLNPHEDFKATMILDSMLQNTQPKKLLGNLKEIIENQIVVVCGAGPSLEKHLREVRSSELRKRAVFIAADGAASALKEYDVTCHIIVTDLDGDMKDILDLTKQDALPIVHAHGDNIQKLEKYVPEFEYVVGSTQIQPTERVFLWGGFTDGDRACYIASHYNPKRIMMIGMDFGDIVGCWSKPEFSEHQPASKRKQIKLEIAEDLLNILIENEDIEFEKMD